VGWRHSELSAFGPEVVPLDSPAALAAYTDAIGMCSRTRYGLDETAFDRIERLDVEGAESAARVWLAERVGDGELLLIFGRDEVFRVPAALFLGNWQDMYCPSRDDVVIVPVACGWALFYCHEDEFEFARCSRDAEPV
jgi:hypothetical protein